MQQQLKDFNGTAVSGLIEVILCDNFTSYEGHRPSERPQWQFKRMNSRFPDMLVIQVYVVSLIMLKYEIDMLDVPSCIMQVSRYCRLHQLEHYIHARTVVCIGNYRKSP